MRGFKKAGEVAEQSAKTRLGSFLKRVRAKYAMNPCTWVRPYGAPTRADIKAFAASEAFEPPGLLPQAPARSRAVTLNQ
jgi:hypothetical protein